MSRQIKPHIGIDLLGSDVDSNQVLESVLPVISKLQNQALFTLFGEEKNEATMASLSFLSYKIASETIQMKDDPLWAIRKKKNSSLLLGIQAVKLKEIDALISLGNTGALTAAASIHLPLLPYITKPALLALIPSRIREVALVDIGANTVCKPPHFIEFAAMGIAYQKMRGIQKPTIGLLNIGTEPTKGSADLREVYQALTELNQKVGYPAFCGNIEGREIFNGHIDVVVTDGFTGNIFLKTCEGMALFLLEQLSPINAPSLSAIQHRLEASEYIGAPLCGIQGIVIKCHGRANHKIFSYCIEQTINLVKGKFTEAIQKEIQTFFSTHKES